MAGKEAAELWGSNKNDTDLQQNHKNDRVDNRMVVISDLKEETKLLVVMKRLITMLASQVWICHIWPICKTRTNHLTWLPEETWNTTIYISSD